MRAGLIVERVRAACLSLLLLGAVLIVWQSATVRDAPPAGRPMTAAEAEYAALMGKAAGPAGAPAKASGFPSPAAFVRSAAAQLADPFYDHGPNDKGIAVQLAASLARVALGYLAAVLVAVPLGFLIGMSATLYRALNPFIQILKPISPLAWMPIALYTIKDAALSGVFVIFICSLWPMLVNTAFGVASVRRDWLNVARTLELTPLRRAFTVILPAAAPTIVTGMRISMGIAWLVIVAAEMLVSGTGIGYFVWNEWNNLSLAHVIFAVLIIGLVGMLLDFAFARLQRRVTYAE